MSNNEELKLLIQSKYPVIYFESIDELYALDQLREVAKQLDLIFYRWSLTDGVIRGDDKLSDYDTKEPVKMLRQILASVLPSSDVKIQPRPRLFALVDFDKHLGDTVVLRLFKDSINRFRDSRNTFVLVSSDYNLPKDIETDAAHLIGGYPAEDEIRDTVEESFAELKRTTPEVKIGASYKELKTIIATLKGLSTQQVRNIVIQCFLDDNVLDLNDLKTIESFKKKTFDQDGLLEFCLTECGDSLAGFNNLKRWLAERKDAFSTDQTYPVPLPVPKGVLLMGVQGCGKSFASKVIARELNLPLYRVDLAGLYSKYIGETEQNMKKALATVEKLSPACLWIDEIEKGFSASAGDIDGGVSMRLLGSFLTWMQEHKSSVFIAATANDINLLPPEFLRKGRFDEIFFADLPDAQARETLFKIHLQKRGLKPENFDLSTLVAMTPDFSGAEIEQAIISALYRASSDKEAISTKHVLEQIETTKPLAVLKREEIAALRAWAQERTIPV
jgi:hypothetical protein